MWLTIAASRSTGAERELIVTARAAVAARMTPTDLREAERRARAWHAAHQGMRNRVAPPSDTGREGLIIALGLFPFSLINSHPFGSARSSPGREAAKRTLDGEDRSGTMKREGKGGRL